MNLLIHAFLKWEEEGNPSSSCVNTNYKTA